MLNKKFITHDEYINVYSKSQLGCIGWKDHQSRFQDLNENAQNYFSCASKDEMVGYTDLQLPWKSDAEGFFAQDNKVLLGQTLTSIDVPQCFDGLRHVALTQKMPFVKEGKIEGVLFFFIPIDPEIFLTIPKIQLDLMTNNNQIEPSSKKKFTYPQVSFTYREAQCVSMILRGSTMLEIATLLHRSPRTIENYGASIREKLGGIKRSFLFNKAIEYGFIELMFRNLK